LQNFVLVIEESKEITELCEQVLGEIQAKVVVAKDAVSAKGILIQSIPSVLICSLKLGDVEDAGFRLCEELQSREEFAQIPMLIVAQELRDGYSKRAREVGLQGLLSWPLTEGDFRSALSAYFSFGSSLPGQRESEFGESEFEVEFEVEESTPKAAPTKKPEPAVKDEKLELAQKLLAQVLHALRTSDLLSVAELEDVPQIVFEMTRGVCGAQQTDSPAKGAERTEEGEEPETSMNLDSVFGLKK